MATTTSPSASPTSGSVASTTRRPWAVLATAVVAALALGALPATAADAREASTSALEDFAASSDVIGSCRATTIDSVPYAECDIATSGHVTFTDDVLFADFGDDVAFTVTAAGGQGGRQSDWSYHYADPGLAGQARTVVDHATLADAGLYLYLGRDATSDYQGGTASVATTTPLDTPGLDLHDVLLVAGGGGAQGTIESSFVCARHGYGKGGDGGRADAAAAGTAVSHRGATGQRGHSYTGCRPSGTVGGGGGDGAGGNHVGNSSRNGGDGVGGLGHGNAWRGDVLAGFLPGRGGGQGLAGGGGGYGGGAAGTGGHGGGGGGSYAASPTATAVALADELPRHASMQISWPLPAPSLVADTDGKGTITVTRPDGTVLCDGVTRCEPSVTPGIQLVVTAMPDPIADFDGFDGDCDVDGDRCTTTHEPGQHVTATFHTPTVPITVRVDFPDPWTNTGWVAHDGETVCGYGTPGDRCTVQVPERAPATLRWGGQQNTVFSHWSAGCSGTGPTCTIDPTGHPTVTATFTHSDGGW